MKDHRNTRLQYNFHVGTHHSLSVVMVDHVQQWVGVDDVLDKAHIGEAQTVRLSLRNAQDDRGIF